MTMRRVWFLTTIALVAGLARPADLDAGEKAVPAARTFERGMEHVRAGELEAALAAFEQARDAEPGVERYGRQAAVVKRVLAIRKYVDEKPVSAKWERMATALHVFYLQHQSHTPALLLARRAHRLQRNAGSEARLAEALLATGRDAETAALLASKVAWPRTQRHGIYLGVALARLGHKQQAQRLLPGLTPAQDAGPTLLRDRARLDALLGLRAAALARLKSAFVATPDSGLQAMKDSVLQCPDFASLFGTPEFEQVMKTSSAVKATSCSGGADCGSCPKRGGCKGAGGK